DVRARNVTDLKSAREQLGATAVLGGTLQYSTSAARVSLFLTDTRSGAPIRSEVVTARLSNPIGLQDAVLGAAVRMLGLYLLPEERASLFAHATRQPGAYDFYLQARGYLLNYDRAENLNNAIAVFRKALEIDARFAAAYAGLGETY